MHKSPGPDPREEDVPRRSTSADLQLLGGSKCTNVQDQIPGKKTSGPGAAWKTKNGQISRTRPQGRRRHGQEHVSSCPSARRVKMHKYPGPDPRQEDVRSRSCLEDEEWSNFQDQTPRKKTSWTGARQLLSKC